MTYQLPWDPGPGLLEPPPVSPAARKPGKARGRRPRQVAAPAAPAAAAQSDGGWGYHRLTVHGPRPDLADFTKAARGPGMIPWRPDTARLEEDLFLMAVTQPAAQRGLSIEGCRILARQLALRVEAHQAAAAAQAVARPDCPIDLHRLLPIPPALLRHGPRDPETTAWMQRRWGPSDALRQVALRPGATAGKRLAAACGVIGYGFFCLDGPPTPAVTALERRWPRLSFRLQIRPDD